MTSSFARRGPSEWNVLGEKDDHFLECRIFCFFRKLLSRYSRLPILSSDVGHAGDRARQCLKRGPIVLFLVPLALQNLISTFDLAGRRPVEVPVER